MYIRTNLDYGDIIYHTASLSKNIFSIGNANVILNKVETIQYTAARIITGAWKGTDTYRLYNTLGWESLNDRRIMRKLCIIYETLASRTPRYLYKILKEQQFDPFFRDFGKKKLITIPCKKILFRTTFFPSTILDWNKLDLKIKAVQSKNIFKKRLLAMMRPKKRPFFGLNNNRIRLITMLRMDLSPLRAHKFKYGFSGISSEFCTLCKKKEDTEHYLLHCKSYALSRTILLQNVSTVLGYDVSSIPKKKMVSIFLYGKEGIPDTKNLLILNYVADYIEKSKRLEKM